MKLKASVFALAAMFMAFALAGCYTQLAKPERGESSSESVEAPEAVEPEYQDENADYRDYDQVTNVYIYDDFYARRYYWERWDPWYAWHYRSPRASWYVRYGYDYGYDYDYWNWTCGTPWDRYYDPWWSRHYASWGPGWGWNYPYYDHYTNYPRGRAHVNEKRPFGRRSTGRDDDNGGAVARRGSDRSHLSKPEGTTYARGDDGVYRRARRTDTESVRDTRTDASAPASDSRRVSRRGATDTRADETVSMPSGSGSSVARPARTRETPTEASQPAAPSSDRRSPKRESSEKEKVSRRSNDSGSSSSSRGSSGSSVGSSRRSSSSGNSGGSSSGVSRSGNSSSGSSSKGSSSGSSSSGNNNSSSGSNRRSRN